LYIYSHFNMLKRQLKILRKKEDITKLSTVIKKSKSIKRVEIKEVYQLQDQINRVRNGKHPYIISINKQIPTNNCHYCHKNGHTNDNCFFSTYQIHQIITIGEKRKKIIIINLEIKTK